MEEISDQQYEQGQCCNECANFFIKQDLDDKGICKSCRLEKQSRMKFINERGIKQQFTKWLQAQNK